MDAFESSVRKAVDKGDVTGAAVVGLYRTAHGYQRYEMALGKQSVEADAPALRTDSLLWTFSCSKLLTSIAAMQLVDRKLLSLDEPLSDILPEYKPPITIASSVNPTDGTPVLTTTDKPLTLRHLLSHTSGFAYDDVGTNALNAWRASLPAADPRSAANVRLPHPLDIEQQYHTPLIFEPGAEGRWNYGCGIDWAGRVVERASGEGLSLGAYMARHIWAPLGMRSTTFRPLSDKTTAGSAADAPVLPMRVDREPGTGQLVPASYDVYTIYDEPVDECGGAGVYSTADDFFRVLESLLRDDGRLLSSEAAAELFRPQVPDHPEVRKSLAWAEAPKVMAMDTTIGSVEKFNWSHSLGGLVARDPIPGKFEAGVMGWYGLSNCYWWVDRKQGTAGFYGTQIFPVGDGPTQALVSQFQKGISSLAV